MSETITDIVREMRKNANVQYARIVPDGYGGYEKWTTSDSFLKDYADRIEAAFKRYIEDSEDEDLVARCETCKFFNKKINYCSFNDSSTIKTYKCNGWKWRHSKEVAK